MFKIKHINSPNSERKWLCFSPATGKLYCFFCKFLGNNNYKTQFLDEGYCDWKNAHFRIRSHELSTEHTQSLILYESLSSELGRIDLEFTKQINEKKNY